MDSTPKQNLEKALIAAILSVVNSKERSKEYKTALAAVPGVHSVDWYDYHTNGEKVWTLPEFENQDMRSFMAHGTPIYFCDLYFDGKRTQRQNDDYATDERKWEIHYINTEHYSFIAGRLGNSIEYGIQMSPDWEQIYDPHRNQIALFPVE